jgi:hypothetical protein
MTRHIIALAVLLASVLGMRPVHAEGDIEVYLSVKTPDPNGKNKNDAPSIEATIVGGPTLPVEKFTLTVPGAKKPVSLKATSLRPFSSGTETVAVAFVFNGQEVWIGNDDLEPEDSISRQPGILKSLKSALQTVPFATTGPPGSKGVLIVYGDKAEIRVPMGPLSNINAEALGTQKDYQYKSGNAMVEGISLALAELHNVTADRKALIIVGDGNDTNPEAAKGQLANLKKQAAAERVQTFAIIYKTSFSLPGNGITAMIPNATTVDSAEGIATAIKAILARMADRYYLTFPGFDPRTKAHLPWDGKEHELVVKIDKDDTEAVSIVLAPVWNPPKEGGGFPWWILGVVVGGLLVVILIGVKVFGSKEEQAPGLMPMPMPMAAPEPPKPMGQMKTVMFNVNGDSDGFPIVGWLVPLNGQHAYQTFRLRSGGTKIGTAPPADIVISDGFMSTDHCMIQCSPQGFTLVDNNSTNGCYVNDKKVAKQELLDNDVITLGKTNFKFKSIN